MAEVINVEKIMDEIRENIRTSGADKIPLTIADQKTVKASTEGPSDLEQAVEYLTYNYEVQPCQLLTGNPVKVFVKRCIRKLAGYFFLPIVQQQNVLNQYYLYVAETVVEQKNEIKTLKAEIERLEKEAK
jgi:hypothetical protein